VNEYLLFTKLQPKHYVFMLFHKWLKLHHFCMYRPEIQNTCASILYLYIKKNGCLFSFCNQNTDGLHLYCLQSYSQNNRPTLLKLHHFCMYRPEIQNTSASILYLYIKKKRLFIFILEPKYRWPTLVPYSVRTRIL
jgi:hypothetical protein